MVQKAIPITEFEMKILHILTSLNTGGSEKFCVDICNTQAEISDNDIYLCVLDRITKEQPLAEKISPNVHLTSLDKTGGYSLKVIFSIYQFLSKLKPDVIHLNGRAMIYASLPLLITNTPSVYTVHTMAHKEYNKYIRSYIKLLFNSFPSIFVPVAISKSVGGTVKQIYGQQHDKVIFNGSSELTVSSKLHVVTEEINMLKKDDDTLVFVYIGRIAPEKNTRLLVEAFNTLLDAGRNVCLCIVGYDTTRAQVYMFECQAVSKHPEHILFVGQKDNIADYLHSADAFCLTSNYEGLGISALEAFSMGVPVLSTPSGGPEDIIVPGVNGYVSAEITVESYLEVLKRFIGNPLKNHKEITALYKEKYTMQVCASRYLDLYQSRKRS